MKLKRPTRGSGRLPCVEVVIPCYNYGSFLPGCVASAVAQNSVEVKVTIVDDKSTDDSAAVAERLADAHPNVKLLRNEVNLGMAGTFNKGVGQVDADYLLLISADDLLAPGALGRATALMEANPRVGLTYGRVQKFAELPHERAALPAESWTIWPGTRWIELNLRRGWGNIASPEAVVRTSVQHAAGGYDPGLPRTLDVEMWLRIAAISDVAHINGVDQGYYRKHPTSHTTTFTSLDDIRERWRAYEQFLSNWSAVEKADELRPVVRRRLADEALLGLLLAMEGGAADDILIDITLEGARAIDPSVVDRGQWSDIQQARSKSPAGMASTARALLRQAARRTGWLRWHRFRYFG